MGWEQGCSEKLASSYYWKTHPILNNRSLEHDTGRITGKMIQARMNFPVIPKFWKNGWVFKDLPISMKSLDFGLEMDTINFETKIETVQSKSWFLNPSWRIQKFRLYSIASMEQTIYFWSNQNHLDIKNDGIESQIYHHTPHFQIHLRVIFQIHLWSIYEWIKGVTL